MLHKEFGVKFVFPETAAVFGESDGFLISREKRKVRIYRERMRGEETVEIVDGEQRRYWMEMIECVHLEDPVNRILPGGDVDGAVLITAGIIREGRMMNLRVNEFRDDCILIGRCRIAC